MAYYDTGSDILEAVARIAEEAPSASSPYLTAMKEAVIQAYWEAWSYAPWPFALVYPPQVLQTVAADDVVATVTQGSATVTLSAAIATTRAGRKFVADADGVLYRISAHTAGSATLTLDVPYTGASGTVAGTIFQDEYTLPAAGSGQTVIKPFRFWFRDRPDLELDFISKAEQDSYRGLGLVTSAGPYPVTVALVTDQVVRLAPWVDEARSIEFDAVERQAPFTFSGSGADNTPKFPRDDRVVIADLAAGRFLTEKKLWATSEARLQMAAGKLEKMVAQYLPTRRNRMRPRRASSVGAL